VTDATPAPRGAAALTPFVAPLAGAARERLLAALGLGDRVIDAMLGPRSGGASEWIAEIRVRLPSGRTTVLELSAAAPRRPALFHTVHLACSYRSGGGDPFTDARDAALFKALRARLTHLDAPGATDAALTAFLRALDTYRPYLAVKDEDYRIVFRGGADPVGLLWLGFGCNQDCRMCWQGRDWPAPPDHVFERWLDELCSAGISSLVLSGGEPTLHPRLPRWIARARAAGVHVTLETNAIRFAEPGYLDALCAVGLVDTVVSLHAADAAVSDALTGAPGTFPRTVAGLRAALGKGLRVGVHCVVESANVGALDEHARFVAEELSAFEQRVRHVSYSFPIRYHRRELYRDAIAPFDVVRPQLSAAVRRLRGAGIEARFLGMSGFPVCAVEHAEAEAHQLPTSVPDDQRTDRTFVEACHACAVKPRCLGVHKTYAEAHGGRGVMPIEC